MWIDETALGYMADMALVVDAATPVIWILLAAGYSGLGLILLRKARDAGVTLSLQWGPRYIPRDTRGQPIHRYEGAPPQRPAGPPAERPLHKPIAWWIEAILVVLTGLTTAVFLDILWTLLKQPWSVKWFDIPICSQGSYWFPLYVYRWSRRGEGCDRPWRMIGLALLYAFNALLAGALNGLSLVLLKILHDGFPWA